jgi:hypothetical protein
MPKGFFTQGAAILFRSAPALDSLAELLPEVLAKRPAVERWEMGGPTLILPLNRELNGLWAIDIVDLPWPDHMGDPKNEPMLFGAWSMGHFGPFTFPGNLERARGQSYLSQSAPPLVEQHRAFVRVRASYAFGAGKDDPVIPEGYDPLMEMMQLTTICGRLLEHPDALLYFNPNGEVIGDRETFAATAAFNDERDQPCVDLWTNVRMWNAGEGWFVMDTVGLGQLDFADHEAVFHRDGVSPNQVASLLRNLSIYCIRQNPTFADGNTTDGPGGLWRVKSCEESAIAPPRPVLRWSPDGIELPESLR